MTTLPQPAYVMSEPHLSGYRVILGYETMTEAQDASVAAAIEILTRLAALAVEQSTTTAR